MAHAGENCNKVTPATKLIMDWENTGKSSPEQQVPYKKGQQENCIDLAFMTPGLEKDLKGLTLDNQREWTPATAEWTGKRKGKDKVYKRGKVSYHKSFEIVLELNIVAQRRSGNIAIIDYNNKLGWARHEISSKPSADAKFDYAKFPLRGMSIIQQH